MSGLRKIIYPKKASVALALFGGFGVFLALLLHGVYNDLYANVFGEPKGVGIFQSFIVGNLSGVVVFLGIYVLTNALIKRSFESPGGRGVTCGTLNAIFYFVISAFVAYYTPYAFNAFVLTQNFLVSAVIGLSSFFGLYDWKLSKIKNPKLRIKDLELCHKDTLEMIHVLTWGSMIFISGVVAVTLINYTSQFQSGSPQALALRGSLVLSLAPIIYVGVGIWFGCIAPLLGRLEGVRLEIRKIDQEYS